MRAARSGARFAVTLGLALAGPPAFALNPALEISQYSHRAWKISDGFFRGGVLAIAQTPDGYLWLGTDFGLLRFDGIRNFEWTPPAEQQLPNNRIQRLLATRDGTLWIGTDRGLASWKGGRLTAYAELAGLSITALFEDQEGAVWVGAVYQATERLCAIRNGAIKCQGEDRSRPGEEFPLYESKGALWVGETMARLWKPTPRLYPLPGPLTGVRDLVEGDNGTLWIATASGMEQFKDGKIEPLPLPLDGQFNLNKLLRDRDGGLWIGTTGKGLLHLHQGKADMFGAANGLSGDDVRRLFEDREGNIWVTTDGGLDRFREFAVRAIPVNQWLSSSVVTSVLAARDGSVWLGSGGGLIHWNNGQITIYRKRSDGPLARPAPLPGVREIYEDGLPQNSVGSLLQDGRGRIWLRTSGGLAYLENDRFSSVGSLPSDGVHSMAEDGAGNLWITDQRRGLLRLRGEEVVEQIPWGRLGHKDFASSMVPGRGTGGLWLGFSRGGVAYFEDGQIRASHTAADGLASGIVDDLWLDRNGALWAATKGGLSRLKNGRVATLTRKNGLPCDLVESMIEDDDHSVWLQLSCGLVRIVRPELDAWVADPTRSIQATVFDGSDGVRSLSLLPGYTPHTAKSADGELWFVAQGGVNVIDPHHFPFNKIPPPVQIEQITVNRKPADGATDLTHPLHLPALIRELQIDYTALSFVAPEKVKFRYKLEGHDRDWIDAGARRQALYNDLSPRQYRFRVQACNNNGVWNEAGASLDFSVAPAYYQTHWFQALFALAAGALIWALYRLRLRQMSVRINLLYNERLAERARIARDLHDTLLQNLAGVSLQLHGISKTAATAPERTPSQVDKIRRQVDDAFREARTKVYNLRSPAFEGRGLTEALSEFIERLGPTTTARCTLHVTGKPVECAPEIEEELLRIAQEAANNANRHSGAKEIRIELEYSGRSLKLSTSDDGRGFHLEEGLAKNGHWGLKNMQERAAQLAGECTITSTPGNGTKVEVHVPLRRWSLRNNLAKSAHSHSGD